MSSQFLLNGSDHNCQQQGCRRSHPHNRTAWRNAEATEGLIELIESLHYGLMWTHRDLWVRYGGNRFVWYPTLVNIVRELRMAGLVHVVGKSGERGHNNALLFVRAMTPAEVENATVRFR